jgi:hypothetical protein
MVALAVALGLVVRLLLGLQLVGKEVMVVLVMGLVVVLAVAVAVRVVLVVVVVVRNRAVLVVRQSLTISTEHQLTIRAAVAVQVLVLAELLGRVAETAEL